MPANESRLRRHRTLRFRRQTRRGPVGRTREIAFAVAVARASGEPATYREVRATYRALEDRALGCVRTTIPLEPSLARSDVFHGECPNCHRPFSARGEGGPLVFFAGRCEHIPRAWREPDGSAAAEFVWRRGAEVDRA